MNRVLIIGSGPAGLAAAACLQRKAIETDLVDRYGEPGGAYRRMYSGITMSSPAAYIHLPYYRLHTKRKYVTVPEFREYLDAYAHHHQLTPQQKEVESVRRSGGTYSVRFKAQMKENHYDAVVVATGMCDNPVWPSIDGLKKDGNHGQHSVQVIHAHQWRGPADFRGKRVLIIGGGMRAVEIAEECGAAGLPVVVSARQTQVKVLPQFLKRIDLRHLYFAPSRYVNIDAFPPFVKKSYCEKRFTFHPIDRGYSEYRAQGVITEMGEVASFDGDCAVFKSGATRRFDVVVLATGYRFATPFLPDEVARTEAGHPRTYRGESVTWPGLFFVGVPCSRTLASQFIHGIVRDAPMIVRSICRRMDSR